MIKKNHKNLYKQRLHVKQLFKKFLNSKKEKRKSYYCNNKNNTEKFIGTYTDITGYQDISGPGHLGTEHMRHLGTRYRTSRYSVQDISVPDTGHLGTRVNFSSSYFCIIFILIVFA
jgi:hypothetical protein